MVLETEVPIGRIRGLNIDTIKNVETTAAVSTFFMVKIDKKNV